MPRKPKPIPPWKAPAYRVLPGSKRLCWKCKAVIAPTDKLTVQQALRKHKREQHPHKRKGQKDA